MKRNKVLFFLLLIIVCILFGVYYLSYRKRANDSAPRITIDEPVITVSVNSTESDLLRGVSAYDEIEGDVSDSLIVTSISTFDPEGCRTVFYAAFDSNGRVTQGSRKIRYSDYVPPYFVIKQSPSMVTWSDTGFLERLSAFDCLDGDISDRITIDDYYSVDRDTGEYEFVISVTNSAGDVSTTAIHAAISAQSRYMPVIELTDYIIYQNVGENFDAFKYIGNVSSGLADDDKINVNYEGTVNINMIGTYHIILYATNSKGYTGQTYMTVVVR